MPGQSKVGACVFVSVLMPIRNHDEGIDAGQSVKPIPIGQLGIITSLPVIGLCNLSSDRCTFSTSRSSCAFKACVLGCVHERARLSVHVCREGGE